MQGLGAALMVSVGAACHVSRPGTVEDLRAPARVVLASAYGLTLRQHPSRGAPAAAPCTVYRLSARVARVSADTLVLQQVSVISQPPEAARCSGDGATFVLLSEAPSLQVLEQRLSGGRTVLFSIVLLPVALLGIAVLAW